MRPSHHIHLVYFLTLISALVFAGCVSKPVIKDVASVIEKPEKPVVKQPEMGPEAGDEAYPDGYYVHTVSVPEENLSIIARWYTGDKKNWTVLEKCNPTIKPNRILLGIKIKIPRSIMTRSKPLPAEFVKKSLPKPQQKPKKKVTPAKVVTTPVKPVVEEAPSLFGPKGN